LEQCCQTGRHFGSIRENTNVQKGDTLERFLDTTGFLYNVRCLNQKKLSEAKFIFRYLSEKKIRRIGNTGYEPELAVKRTKREGSALI
jgi:hypothetical protein